MSPGTLVNGAPNLLLSVLLGQSVSLCDTISALAVKLLVARQSFNSPHVQYFITYSGVLMFALLMKFCFSFSPSQATRRNKARSSTIGPLVLSHSSVGTMQNDQSPVTRLSSSKFEKVGQEEPEENPKKSPPIGRKFSAFWKESNGQLGAVETICALSYQDSLPCVSQKGDIDDCKVSSSNGKKILKVAADSTAPPSRSIGQWIELQSGCNRALMDPNVTISSKISDKGSNGVDKYNELKNSHFVPHLPQKCLMNHHFVKNSRSSAPHDPLNHTQCESIPQFNTPVPATDSSLLHPVVLHLHQLPSATVSTTSSCTYSTSSPSSTTSEMYHQSQSHIHSHVSSLNSRVNGIADSDLDSYHTLSNLNGEVELMNKKQRGRLEEGQCNISPNAGVLFSVSSNVTPTYINQHRRLRTGQSLIGSDELNSTAIDFQPGQSNRGDVVTKRQKHVWVNQQLRQTSSLVSICNNDRTKVRELDGFSNTEATSHVRHSLNDEFEHQLHPFISEEYRNNYFGRSAKSIRHKSECKGFEEQSELLQPEWNLSYVPNVSRLRGRSLGSQSELNIQKPFSSNRNDAQGNSRPSSYDSSYLEPTGDSNNVLLFVSQNNNDPLQSTNTTSDRDRKASNNRFLNLFPRSIYPERRSGKYVPLGKSSPNNSIMEFNATARNIKRQSGSSIVPRHNKISLIKHTSIEKDGEEAIEIATNNNNNNNSSDGNSLMKSLFKLFSVGSLGFFIALSWLDLQGGSLTVAAYKYASLSSTCLIDCISLLTAFVLSVNFLGERQNKYHIFAVVVGILGSLCILTSDYFEADTNDLVISNANFTSPLNQRVLLYQHTVDKLNNTLFDIPPADNLMTATENLTSLTAGQRRILKAQALTVLGDETSKFQSENEGNPVFLLRQLDKHQALHAVSPDVISVIDGHSNSVATILPETSSIHLNKLYGDVMCVVAAIILGLSSVLMENGLKNGISSARLLTKMGYFGSFFAALQWVILEGNMESIREMASLDAISWIYLLIASLSMSGAYCLSPIVLLRSGSSFFNLSLMTSGGLSVLLSAWLFGDDFPILYSVGLVAILGSLIVYHQGDTQETCGEDGAV